VDDLVEGICRLMDVEFHDPVNLGSPEEYNMLELAKLIQKITDSSASIEFKALPQDDPKQRRPDITLAKKLLSWNPQVPLREGLERTADYFRSMIP
jgi:dTDP-glucose 4,6-dehydratase